MSTAPAAAPIPSVKVPAGTTAGAAVREAGLPTTGPHAVVVVRDSHGGLRDLGWTPSELAEVDPVPADSDEGRSVIRHSAAHVLAQAVQDKFPDAKLGIGPPIRDGFYYDFDVARPFTPEDLADLDKRMRKIIKSGQRFSRRVVASIDDAKSELATEPYKLELVDLKSEVAGAGDAEESVEVGQIFRGEGLGHVEVVIETVPDRRTDAELGVRELVLHRLRQHVRRRVPDHRSTVLGIRRYRFGVGVLARRPRQVAEQAPSVPDDDDRLWTAGRHSGIPDGRAGSRARCDLHGRRGHGNGGGGHGVSSGGSGLAGESARHASPDEARC